MTWQVHCGDSAQVLALYPDECFDSMCCDPPAGIKFMGKKWDGDHGGRDKWIEWLTGILREAHRVLKPGASCFIWALPRTQHWTQTAIENAGFEVRDVCMHLFGSGFPKSLDVSKAIDAAAGAERESVMVPTKPGNKPEQAGEIALGATGMRDVSAPATDAAKQWDGWGTALKPAHESWILARKPLIGTVAANVLEHGTGALNVDGCRVGTDDGTSRPCGVHGWQDKTGGFTRSGELVTESHTAGRWPPNLVLTHSADCTRIGTATIKANPAWNDNRPPSSFTGPETSPVHHSDEGEETVAAYRCADDCPVAELAKQGKATAQTLTADDGTVDRFFPTFNPDPPNFPFRYSAKPSSAERDAGLETFAPLSGGEATGRVDDSAGTESPRAGAGRKGNRRNGHATVKGSELMRWLVRLITPENGIVLDPFCGSGSTGIACVLEGFDFHGIELDAYHCDLSSARIAHVAGGGWEPRTEKATSEKPKQGSLF